MRNLSMLVFVFSSFTASLAMAADAKIDIISPADGAKLNAKAQAKVSYEVTLGGAGDHTHLYVDGREATVLREKKGTYTLDLLEPGGHQICIRMVDKNHTPVGVERCIKVTAE